MFGAICGDISGSVYEFEEKKYYDLSQINLINEKAYPTDDTAMTVAVADWLLHCVEDVDDDEKLKFLLAEKFLYYGFDVFDSKMLGFGFNFRSWLIKFKLTGEYAPINSYGNGAGMRVSPVGWMFDTLEETLRFAKITADVTHNHPEGVRGAQCIAAAVYLARTGKSKAEIKKILYDTFGYEILLQNFDKIRNECTWSEICQDTVPMSVVAFLESEDYSSALKLAYSYGSDSDTIGAMSGAIAEAYYNGVPSNLWEFCKTKLPKDIYKLCDEFQEIVSKKLNDKND